MSCLFPNEDAESFKMFVEAPMSMSLDQHANALRIVEQAIENIPDTERNFYTTTVGSQTNSRSRTSRGSQYSELSVYLKDPAKRTRSAQDIVQDLRKTLNQTPHPFTSIRFSIRRGPPVSKPISLNLYGPNYKILTQQLKNKNGDSRY